jgi:hypothetical protein
MRVLPLGRIGGVLPPSGTVIFRDENPELTRTYLQRVPEGSTRPSAPDRLFENENPIAVIPSLSINK